MVKKISGTPPPSGPTNPVEGPKATEAAKVGGVGQVGATQEKSKADAVQGKLRQLTSKDRDQIFQMIHEEAEKLFAEGTLPPKKKATVEEAVKMAIDSGIVDEDEKPRP